jgi:cytochrome P450
MICPATFRRLATADVQLSNGYLIKKGTRVVFENTHMWDEKYYENPYEYDGYRWLRLRDDPTKEHLAHLVSTSTQQMGFGHGLHSCPGRFFAANEIKIGLCHLLLKYDWKFPEGTATPKPFHLGMAILPDPNAKLVIRRRTPEIDLDSLEAEGFL